MKKTLILAIGLATAMGLAACSTSRTSSPVQQSAMHNSIELSAYRWILSSVTSKGKAAAPAPVVGDNKPLVLDFSEQGVSVSGLCNQLGGSYRLDGRRISISQMMGTLMACADSELMRYEQQVGRQLPEVTHWRLEGHADAPVLVLTFADDNQWQLQGEPTAETPVSENRP